MTRLVPLLLVTAMGTCQPVAAPPLVEVTGGTAGAGDPEGGSGGHAGAPACTPATACALLEALGCVQDAVVCTEQVRTIQALGPRASIDLPCLCAATSVEAVRACESVTCGGL